MNAATFAVLALIAFVVLIFFTIIFLASRYKRCPSDRVLVIFGRVQKGHSKSVKLMTSPLSGRCKAATPAGIGPVLVALPQSRGTATAATPSAPQA